MRVLCALLVSVGMSFEIWSSIYKLATHNLQTAHIAEYQKHKQLNKKIGRRPKQTFLQRRHTDGQEVHEKTINISNYQRNANQIYNEVSPHINQNGHHQSPQTINAGKGMEKREPFYTINECKSVQSLWRTVRS